MVAVKDRQERAEEPVRPPQGARHHPRDGARLADGVGAGAPARVVPGVRRRLRHGPHRRGRAATPRPSRRRGCTAPPSAASWASSPGRDPVNPQGGQDCAADVYRQAGITNPRRGGRRRRVLRAVQLVRADVDGEPRVRRRRRGLEAHRGRRDRDERRAAGQRSGGVLSSNPIGASGMLRFAEAAMQVRGQAGEHQVDGVAHRGRPRLRRRRPVLRHVGPPDHEAVSRHRDAGRTSTCSSSGTGPCSSLTMNRPERRNALSPVDDGRGWARRGTRSTPTRTSASRSSPAPAGASAPAPTSRA